jgi:colicin import membrane protein
MPSVIERWRPYLLSVAVHVALLLVIVVLSLDAWKDLWQDEATPPLALAIEAVPVDGEELARLARAARTAKPAPEPIPEPELAAPPPPQIAPPKALEPPATREPPKREVPKREVPKREQPKRPEPKVESPSKPTAAALAVEAARKADAARAAADAKRFADEVAAEERRRQDDARVRAEREAALQRDLAAETEAAEAAAAARAAAARAASLSAQWAAAIQARVQRAWIRPASAVAGLDCRVLVTQAPGGTVLSAEVRACNGDDSVRQSIEAAVFRASPLPPPPDPSLFERNIDLRFRPND